jgi:transcriptional regulator with XRE-family HTH domain
VARRIKGKRIALGLAEIDVAAVLGVEDAPSRLTKGERSRFHRNI